MRFYLIDKIIEWEPKKYAKGLKTVSLSEDFFTDHFPKNPVMPGVLIVESLAQLAGLLLEEYYLLHYNKNKNAIMSILENFKFRTMAKPGDCIVLEATVEGFNEISGKTSVKASINNKIIAGGNIIFAFFDVDNPTITLKKNEHVRILKEV